MTPKNIICLQCYCSDCCLRLSLSKSCIKTKTATVGRDLGANPLVLVSWRPDDGINDLSPIDWMMRRACVCVCMCVGASLISMYLICKHAARKVNFYSMPDRHKKVIDANVGRRREGNRANQLIKHFIRLVKPCGNFTASSEGEPVSVLCSGR